MQLKSFSTAYVLPLRFMIVRNLKLFKENKIITAENVQLTGGQCNVKVFAHYTNLGTSLHPIIRK